MGLRESGRSYGLGWSLEPGGGGALRRERAGSEESRVVGSRGLVGKLGVREEAVFVKEREEFATKQSSYWAARLVLLPARFLLLTQMGLMMHGPRFV
jgi:hypothetical protein